MNTYDNCWKAIQGNCFTTMSIYSSKKKENNGFYYYHNLSKSHQKQEITRPKTFLLRKLFISFRLPCIVTNVNQTQKHRLSIYFRIEDLTHVFIWSRPRLLLIRKISTNRNEMNHDSLNIIIQGSMKIFSSSTRYQQTAFLCVCVLFPSIID